MHVAIVGIGGLGHLALQFAKAWGCEVTAISSSADKEAQARELGADHFVISKEEGALEALEGKFDFILSTVCANLNWAAYVNMLRPKGTLCFVGVTSEDIRIPAFPLIVGQRRVVGSPIGSPGTIRKMLDFVVEKQVKTQVETFPMSEVNQAIDRVRKNAVRYRVVLCNEV